MRIESPAFSEGAVIPQRYTCEGADVSPPLGFTVDVPGVQSLALVVDDPDAPRGTWVHWIVYNLPAGTTALPEDLSVATLLRGARFGVNSWGRATWGGPCPPSGKHRYVFTLYALDAPLPELKDATREALVHAMASHLRGQATLTGTYSLSLKRRARQAASRV